MKKTESVIHIPERGCHNCRLHCVNHKKCDSEWPCKQGIEWRPIIQTVEPQETKRDNTSQVEKQTAEEILDLQQYITNLLYDALEQGFKLRHYAGIGEGFRNADTGEFDKWVEEQTNLLKEYAQQERAIEVTDEEINKYAEQYQSYIHVRNFDRGMKQGIKQGAKWLRDNFKSKQP